MEGEGIPGNTIVVRCGDEQWDAIVDADGTWHVELGELDNGEYEFEVQEINPKTGKVSDATECTLNNDTSNADRQWQREGAKDRIKTEGTQSYGPPESWPQGGGGAGGGAPQPTDSGLGTDTGESKPPDGGAGTATSAGGTTSGKTEEQKPGFEKGNAPPTTATRVG